MANEIQIFNNPNFGEIRTVINENGEPMFCAADVCKALGYTNPRKAVADHVGEDDVTKRDIIDNLGRTQTASFVNESGLYSLIFGSKLDSAKAFKKWVTSEVLPTIRKTGSYTMSTPKTYSEALRQLADEVEAKEKAQLLLAEKSEQLDESKEWYSIKRWAKLHRKNWRSYSWRKLKAVSHELGYEVKKIFDGNYDEVNIYHKVVFEAVYGK